MITLEDRKHLFIDKVFTTDTKAQLEGGGTDAKNTALDLIELAWDEALRAQQELNGDL